MKGHICISRLVLASSLVVVSAYATAQNSTVQSRTTTTTSVPDNTVDMSDPHAQVVAVAGTTNVTGNQVTIRSVQSQAIPDASRPSFDALDTNHDGVISESEAGAYFPLVNDYLHVARKGSRGVTRAEYESWH